MTVTLRVMAHDYPHIADITSAVFDDGQEQVGVEVPWRSLVQAVAEFPGHSGLAVVEFTAVIER